LPLFAPAAAPADLGAGAALLRGFALPFERALAASLEAVAARAPFRHMLTPGGFRMSVAMTSCGDYGWVSSESGYRYTACDPDDGRCWPPMPASFLELAGAAAERAGYAHFAPDSCLVNRYVPGARLTLHQDRDERDFAQPIVSVSLGVPATFLWGGLRRKDRPARMLLEHGDVVVFGGAARRRYHGVAPLAAAEHPFAGGARINLTLRRAQ
jgi:alkylated DNA repair protein (DNA oxidative demethylase)